jgi:biotin carboxylase
VVAGDSRANGPRLLVLGAGPAQLGLLEAARARGVWTAVVDRNPAAPGFRLADRRCIVSTEDEPSLERLAAALDLDGIISPGTDWPVPVAARVAERLGLPHPISPQTALLATNKLRQRERLAAAGVPQPRWQVVTDDPVRIDPPCVVKAPDRQGQKGLTLVLSREELPAAVETARGASRLGAAMVEELADGPEVTVIGFSTDGAFTAVAVTDRVTAAPPAFGVALAHVYPCAFMADEAAEVARQAVKALEIANGPSYTQVRMSTHSPQVMELAARLGGGHDAELAEAATSVSLNDMAISAAFGEDVSPPRVEPRVGGAVTRFLVAPAGVLESVAVPDDLDGVLRVRIYREPGYVVPPLRHGSDRAGAVLAVGTSREEALARADAAAARIRFEVAAAGALAS